MDYVYTSKVWYGKHFSKKSDVFGQPHLIMIEIEAENSFLYEPHPPAIALQIWK
jgi:hypothetical protein